MLRTRMKMKLQLLKHLAILLALLDADRQADARGVHAAAIVAACQRLARHSRR